MSAFVRALLALVVSLLALGSPVGTAVAAPASSDVPMHIYDSRPGSARAAAPATKRGPPTTSDRTFTYDALDPGLRGASARPDGPTPPSAFAYDLPSLLVETARATTRAGRDVQVADRDLSSISVAKSAAKSEAGVLRLSTQESWGNLKTLDRHFRDHGADFGASNADDCARMAAEFFQRGGAERLPTKIASDGTFRMYDPATNTFGSFNPAGQTKTFFKPTSSTYWDRQPGTLVP